MFCTNQNRIIFAPSFATLRGSFGWRRPLNVANGALAQLVEQRTENPCVPGSIPGGTTTSAKPTRKSGFFYAKTRQKLAFVSE